MALLERVATLVRANLNDLVDQAEDPEKMIKQVILDMQNQLLQVKTQVAISIADQHVLEGKLREAEERRLQVIHLCLLILHLLPETGGGSLVAHAALHGGARQWLIFLVDCDSRAVHPLPLVLFRFQ